MIAKMEVVPFQRLPVGVETLHQTLLDRKRAVPVMAAVKDHRGAFNLPRGIARVTRSDARRWLIGYRGIIGDEGSRGWCRGNEVNAQPPAHAVADDSNPRGINIVAPANITPPLVDDSNKIRVQCLVLNLRALIDVCFRRITEHVIQTGNHCGVTELSKPVSGGLQISG